MLPKLWISIMLTLLLLVMTHNLYTKARASYKRESQARAAAAAALQQRDEEAGGPRPAAAAGPGQQDAAGGEAAVADAPGQTGEQLLLVAPDQRAPGGEVTAAHGDTADSAMQLELQLQACQAKGGRCSAPWATSEAEVQRQLGAVLAADHALLNPLHLALLALMTAWVIGIGALKGVLPCGSWQQWLVAASVLLPSGFVLAFMRCRLLRAAAIKARSHVGAAAGGARALPPRTELLPQGREQLLSLARALPPVAERLGVAALCAASVLHATNPVAAPPALAQARLGGRPAPRCCTRSSA
jgi:hypothetical protein